MQKASNYIYYLGKYFLIVPYTQKADKRNNGDL